MRTFKIQHGQRLLSDVVGTLNPPCRLAYLLNRRQQHPDQNPDDGDHHEKFDQRKSRFSLVVHATYSIAPQNNFLGAKTLKKPVYSRMIHE